METIEVTVNKKKIDPTKVVAVVLGATLAVSVYCNFKQHETLLYETTWRDKSVKDWKEMYDSAVDREHQEMKYNESCREDMVRVLGAMSGK